MIAEIISVGTELLLGDITDTNAVELSAALAASGITLYHRQTVGDNYARLVSALQLALSRADIVITIGGLGPTEDDLSKEAAADAMGDVLIEDPAHREWLERRMGGRASETLPQSFYKQALIPSAGRGLANPSGTALGAWFERRGKLIICLPGPPNEFRPMLREQVLPALSPRNGVEVALFQSRVLKVIGLGESLVEERLRDLMRDTNPTLSPYAKIGEVHLRITASAPSLEAGKTMIAPVEEEIRVRLGSAVYGADKDTLEGAVVHLLRRQEATMTTAESCTGGLVSERITRISGSSTVFREGFVVYSNEAKERLLSVPAEIIREHGAVSSETAIAMALGARRAAVSDWAISITGIAGPEGGSEEKPVGTVHIGIASEGEARSAEFHYLGDRLTVRQRASQDALNMLRLALLARLEGQRKEQ